MLSHGRSGWGWFHINFICTALSRSCAGAQCKLMVVPAVVERLMGLRILDLTNNRLSNGGLPIGLARLPHLKAIGLKKNVLTAVPRVLGHIRSLQEIYLEDNIDLEVTPGAVCSLLDALPSVYRTL